MTAGSRANLACVAALLGCCGFISAQEPVGARLGSPVGVEERAKSSTGADLIPLEAVRPGAQSAMPEPEAPLPDPVINTPAISRIPTTLPAVLPGAELTRTNHQIPAGAPTAACDQRRPQSWLRAEYLLWRTSGQNIPTLVTTSPAGTPLASAGRLGEPGTTILFGGERYDGDWLSGGRFTIGAWLDRQETLGVQGRFWMLENGVNHFAAASGGVPILAIPFVDPIGAQQRLLTAYPGVAFGAIDIHTSSRLHAADIDAMINLRSDCRGRCDLLVGWRHVQLGENLRLRDLESLIGDDGSLADQVLVEDHIVTRNQFHGVDLGVAGAWRRDLWTVDLLGKIALGVNRQTVEISGASRDLSGVTAPGGIFALSSNSGQHTRSVFAVAPELNVNLGCQVTRNFRLLVGYSVLYLNNVVRPGSEIDTTINPNLLPPAVPGGPARPAVQFRDTDFWAQGVSVGGEWRW